MRLSLNLAVLAALALLGGCQKPADTSTRVPVPPAAPLALPKAPGLWIERVTDRGDSTETKICLDATSAQQLSALGGKLGGKCESKDAVKTDAGGWRFADQCDMGDWGKVASDVTVKGDPDAKYEVDAISETAGAADASANGPRHVHAEIRRQGACPKDMKPGDVVWADGRRSRLSDLAAAS